MRDLLAAGRSALLTLTALKYGWRRRGVPFMVDGRGPFVTWVSPWGIYAALEPSVLPEPLRQKIVCDQRLHMSGICPCCGARASHEEGRGIVCEHEPDCPVAAESIYQSAEASAN